MKKLISMMLTGILTLSLCACTGGIIAVGGDTGSWNVGDSLIKEEVTAIEIDWASGSVDVIYSDMEEVTVAEITTEDLKDSEKVHWTLDGTTLKITYCAEKVGIHTTSIGEKRLTVAIPDGVVLDKLEINSASSQITASVNAEKMDVNSASGNIRIHADSIGELDVDSASGDVTATLTAFDAVDIDIASGDITFLLPENADFTAEIDAVSGTVDSELEMQKDGDKYICGEGTAKIEIDAVSGDVEFLKQ